MKVFCFQLGFLDWNSRYLRTLVIGQVFLQQTLQLVLCFISLLLELFDFQVQVSIYLSIFRPLFVLAFGGATSPSIWSDWLLRLYAHCYFCCSWSSPLWHDYRRSERWRRLWHEVPGVGCISFLLESIACESRTPRGLFKWSHCCWRPHLALVNSSILPSGLDRPNWGLEGHRVFSLNCLPFLSCISFIVARGLWTLERERKTF